MKKTTILTMLGSTMITGTTFANPEIPNYKPTTVNQVGRYVDHNKGDTYVNPSLLKSISLARKNLQSLKLFEDDITEDMGHVIIYGNKLKNVNEFYGTKNIHGSLIMHDNEIENLDGFQQVENIGGGLHLYDNNLECNIDGLLNVETIGSDVIITDSAFRKCNEVDMRGFQKLKSVNNGLNLSGIKIKSSVKWMIERVTGILELSNTGLTNTNLLQELKYAGDINLRGNNLNDISSLHEAEVEGHILIDKAVLNNPHFRGLRSSAKLCQTGQAKHFHPNGISQKEACNL
ncbi:hypothetical protein [Vreelandella neptunia]|uniref:Uncharacterized protein n=1 Tax=Vreelandella neptunia TaxID=115551 RepID=A0ABS9S9T2_9GAMM|nr:hypothetical protein [Halomonas neptunia]MCH4812840.1 hypothetical protein [Halomonas neptunia]